MTRFQYDFSLLSTLLDHYRPETHTFHFTVGEMMVTLQDTSLLMGLPCEGEPPRAANISAN
jgi:non-ribosomal peptide synthetase component F